MCQEASSEDDDIRSSEKITSDHDSASNIHQGGTDATDAMDVFSTLLTGLSTANMLIGAASMSRLSLNAQSACGDDARKREKSYSVIVEVLTLLNMDA